MPNFAVNGATPAQIAQVGTEPSVVRNTGEASVFLDAYSSVSSSNYGIELQPFDSINTGQGRDLFAVCAPGETSTLSVFYGAEGVSLGAVSAVVTGDVTATIDGPVDANILGTVTVDGDVSISGPVTANISGTVPVDVQNAVINADVTGNIVVDSGTVNVGGILTPVQVQGGGAVLSTTTGNLTPGSGVTINIPAPASGLTYPGLGLIITNTSKSITNDVPLTAYVYNNSFAAGVPTRFQAGSVANAGGLKIGDFGATATTSVVVPVGASFPIRVDLNHEGAASTLGYRVIAVGLSYTGTFPQGFTQWENGVEVEVNFDAAALGSFATIAASFERREFVLVSATGSAGNFVVDVLNSDGTWSTIQSRAHNSLYGGNVGAATVQANANSIIIIPGDGRSHRVRTLTAVVGTVRLTYLGKTP